MMKTNTIKQVKELTTPFNTDVLEPNAEADIAFSASTDATTVCQNYGQICTAGLDPSKCYFTAESPEVAAKSSAFLQAFEPYNIMVLECELVSEITGSRTSCSIERRGQNQHEISYQPTIKGRHQLHITVEGQHVRGSPFTIAVKSPVKTLGTPILTISEVKLPTGVVVNQRGELVVAELGGHCVSVISPSGKKLQSVAVQHVRGVTVDGEGNFFVSCENNHIQRFTGDGHFIKSVGTKGSGLLQFETPIDIAFNASNSKVYIADSGNHRIQVLNSDLTFSGAFGEKGKWLQFHCPWGISCDSTGKVYVTDTYNRRIQVFTVEEEFLLTFGSRGQSSGEMYYPIGGAIDSSSSMVYVNEEAHGRVSVFTSKGRPVTSFRRNGRRPGELDRPGGLTVE